MVDIILAIPWLPIAIGVSAATSLGTSIAGMKLGSDQASDNLAFQKQNLQYQQGLQNRIFEREDNAVQRRAADLESAGLSKTLAAGSPAGAGQVIKTDAPQDTKADKMAQGLQQLGQLGNLAQTFANIDALQAQKLNANSQAYLTSQKARIVKHDADIWDKRKVPSTTNGSIRTLNDVISMIKGIVIGRGKPGEPTVVKKDEYGKRPMFDFTSPMDYFRFLEEQKKKKRFQKSGFNPVNIIKEARSK